MGTGSPPRARLRWPAARERGWPSVWGTAGVRAQSPRTSLRAQPAAQWEAARRGPGGDQAGAERSFPPPCRLQPPPRNRRLGRAEQRESEAPARSRGMGS